MAGRDPTGSYSFGSPEAERQSYGPPMQKTAESMVTCLYQTHIAGFWRNVTVMWTKNHMNCSLSICVESAERDHEEYRCKIDLKPWYFWAKKGYKTFEVDGNKLDVYWDLRSAKFSDGPEPCKDFYIALVFEEEAVLLLGDLKEKAYKTTEARPPLVEAVMFYKKEHVLAKKSFSTRAKFDNSNRDHGIIVESSMTGPREPEMWISIDGIVLIHVRNLQWKFRGNQTVLVNKQPVEVLWDIYPWLFCAPGSDHGLFIFKPGAAESDSDTEDKSQGTGSDCSSQSHYVSLSICMEDGLKKKSKKMKGSTFEKQKVKS